MERLSRALYFQKHARVYIIAPMGGIVMHGLRMIETAADFEKLRTGESFVCIPDQENIHAAAIAYAYEAGGGWLIVDEVDMLCSPYCADPYLMRAIRYGRHRGLGLVAASQRPANVNRNLTAQADQLVCFTIREPRDIQALALRIGIDQATRLASLPPHKFLIFK